MFARFAAPNSQPRRHRDQVASRSTVYKELGIEPPKTPSTGSTLYFFTSGVPPLKTDPWKRPKELPPPNVFLFFFAR